MGLKLYFSTVAGSLEVSDLFGIAGLLESDTASY